MPAIERTAFVRAPPAAVFDLVSRVEDFASYTRVIREVRRQSPDLYRWIVSVAGFELEWDSRITEHDRPHRLAWSSVRGIENGGCFELAPAGGGTRVQLAMHYRLANPLLERVVDRLAAPLMERIACEILEQVRRRLEQTSDRQSG